MSAVCSLGRSYLESVLISVHSGWVGVDWKVWPSSGTCGATTIFLV